MLRQKKFKKIFLENLITYGSSSNKGKINWRENIGKSIHFIYDNIEDDLILIEVITTPTKKTNLIFSYNNKILNPIATGNFIRCQLGNILEVFTPEFKYEIGQRIIDYNENGTIKRDFIITDCTKIKAQNDQWLKYYKYKCNLCGFDCGEYYSSKNEQYYDEYWVLESGIKKNSCSCCCESSNIVVENINSIITTAPWLIPYFPNGYTDAKKYTKTSNKSIIPICPDCECKKSKKTIIGSIYRCNSIACTCSDGVSYPNKFAFKMLKELNIDFINEYSPDWIKPKAYDFYIPSLNVIIEMDGALGHGNKVHNKDTKTIEESKAIDNYKDEQAQLHGIEVIRIDSKVSELDYIKKNILLKLSKLFNFTNIDWLELEKYSLSNLVKIACKYKQDNLNITSTKIGEIMGYSDMSIRRWLKRGTEVGWCEYDATLEKSKSITNNKKLNSMPLICLNTLDIFESTRDCERRCEKILGVKFYASSIGESCRKNGKPSKGFSFKYISDLTDEEKQKYNIA
jgi:hypothetical protein